LDGLINCLHRYEEMLQDVEEKEEGSEVVACHNLRTFFL
jgi:hypothetical protein